MVADVVAGDVVTYALKRATASYTGGQYAGRTKGPRGNLRDSDPAAHLEKLKDVSLAISSLARELAPTLPPRLNHFMERASYDKALAFLEDQPIDGPH